MMITEHATISRKNGTKKEIRTIQGDKGTISTQSLCGKVGHSPTPEHGTKKPPITIQTAPGFTITVTAKKKKKCRKTTIMQTTRRSTHASRHVTTLR
jgi:hypothetical protein